MSLSLSSPEPTSAAQLAALEEQLATIAAERDRLAHERDEYKSQAEWLHKQLERLKYDAKTPRERVDPRPIQLVFEPFAQALLGATASAASAEPTSPEGDGRDPKKKRSTAPHGRRVRRSPRMRSRSAPRSAGDWAIDEPPITGSALCGRCSWCPKRRRRRAPR